MKMIPLVAHRGFCAAYPENSLESLKAALECGAAAVEFDVQLTLDHVAVVCHDDNLSRTAGVDFSILQNKYVDMRSICVGEPRRFADQFLNCLLPSLDQVVELLLEFPQAIVFVEIKIESIEAFGAELFNKVVLESIAPILSRCVLISDDLDALLAARERAAIPIGWIIHQWSEPDRLQATEAGPEYLVVNHKYFPAGDENLWPGDWLWVVYETSKANKALDLYAMGIQWVETNNICPMLESLQKHDAPILTIKE
ncbi:MAG: glycerophosphodiester phosphodiesterase family protein [Gammaproteobacteria bacterium]|nr:glycerophosphodiester phosphodiesterase family protein [Gammaproteobacteria bacterium]